MKLTCLANFLLGAPRYRHFKPSGNPISRFCQVIIAVGKNWRVEMPPSDEELYEVYRKVSNTNNGRRILHTQGFKFLDRVAYISSRDFNNQKQGLNNLWHLCPVTQVEEVKCILRLLPIWLCTILYSVVFTQMASLFVEQGAAMSTTISKFQIPPASLSIFDILSIALFIFIYRTLIDPIDPIVRTIKGKSETKGLIELQRMGVGLVIAILAMVSTGIVECYRLKYAKNDCLQCEGSSSLSIFWQVPQYALIRALEVFMYMGQLEFFNAQSPDDLKSFGSALCKTSIALGNYFSSLLVSIVMKILTVNGKPGWIPGNLNRLG
ncbi:Proton-dependent oligopeptide transporter family [Dillenia turbinata]|uniref:Proton-dependent oligopeptide transporter family n=1 Tax=Dillenia turbinata TaxID=194707 RepID=A0AAN8W9L7_9MAGN